MRARRMVKTAVPRQLAPSLKLTSSADGRMATEVNGPSGISLPLLPSRFYTSRPPVQASLRLAPLGLDGTRPRRPGIASKKEWQALSCHPSNYLLTTPAFSWKD
jgi:hypothetical protein